MGACVETADVAAALDVEDLPDALLEAIFQHLDAPTLLLSVAPASRRFRGASASLVAKQPLHVPAQRCGRDSKPVRSVPCQRTCGCSAVACMATVSTCRQQH